MSFNISSSDTNISYSDSNSVYQLISVNIKISQYQIQYQYTISAHTDTSEAAYCVTTHSC